LLQMLPRFRTENRTRVADPLDRLTPPLHPSKTKRLLHRFGPRHRRPTGLRFVKSYPQLGRFRVVRFEPLPPLCRRLKKGGLLRSGKVWPNAPVREGRPRCNRSAGLRSRPTPSGPYFCPEIAEQGRSVSVAGGFFQPPVGTGHRAVFSLANGLAPATQETTFAVPPRTPHAPLSSV
jgi:hypothetical protein